MLLGVYLVVFGLLFPNAKTPHYPIYLLSGLACWLFFSVSLQSAARSMIDSGELIKKVRFPRQLVPFSMVATQAVTFGVMLVVLIVLSLVFVPDARPTCGLASRCRSCSSGSSRGSSLLAACLNVLFRDVEHIIAAGLLPWFFLTPILWSIDNLPARAQEHPALLDVLRWGNPLAPPIFAIRDAIWSGHAPRLADVIYLARRRGDAPSGSARSSSAASTIRSRSSSNS